MKEVKKNIRSFRYSDKVAKVLEQAEGSTLNEKFENLVLQCHCELPEIKKNIEFYEDIIRSRKSEYYRLDDINDSFENVMTVLYAAKNRLDNIIGAYEDK